MRRLIASVVIAGFLVVLALSQTVRGQVPPPPPPPGGGTPPVGRTFVPPPAPGATSTPTSTPQPTATATNTPVPPSISLKVKLSRSVVRQGGQQTVSVTTTSGAVVAIAVKFPDGESKTHGGHANGSGKFSWTFVQPSGVITHGSRSARVGVGVSRNGASRRISKYYRIAFARVDISVEPRVLRRGQMASVWVHASGRTFVIVDLAYRGGKHFRTYGTTESGGWLVKRVKVLFASRNGRGTATALAIKNGFRYQGKSYFSVRS